MEAPPVVLTIAGSDSSAGAGIQADLKSITANGCYALTTVTCVVAEIPGRVTSIQAVKPKVVRDQIALAFEAFPIAAVKTGMLYSAGIVEAVVDALRLAFEGLESLPAVVVDPVMVATSGDPLLKKEAIRNCRKLLFPMATLITPNLDELSILTKTKPTTVSEMKAAGEKLCRKTECAVLCKGGHLQGEDATDVLVSPAGADYFSARFLDGVSTHGTGCTYSSAIAAHLARDKSLPDAVARAKTFLTSSIKHTYSWGSTQALNHQVFHEKNVSE